ncbi:hypothetical protein FHQ08_03910 [Lactobacillus sp. CC-MHH1034]|uniref:hypothetical protein n=1 Tax=Agrilactobacillus fermenti TaxID=2586909 RepID=UPI001E42CEBA|nr:hypothetical protein [Agrilactobacillus fermenti]MCD2255861.1 hypothetical protein [Agrilactobacillus fermenti]
MTQTSKHRTFIILFLLLLLALAIGGTNDHDKVQAQTPTKISTAYLAQQVVQQNNGLNASQRQATLLKKIDQAASSNNLTILTNYLSGWYDIQQNLNSTPLQPEFKKAAIPFVALLMVIGMQQLQKQQTDAYTNFAAVNNFSKLKLATGPSNMTYASDNNNKVNYDYSKSSGVTTWNDVNYGAEYLPKSGLKASSKYPGSEPNSVDYSEPVDPTTGYAPVYLNTVRTMKHVPEEKSYLPYTWIQDGDNAYDRLSRMHILYATGVDLGPLNIGDGEFRTGYTRGTNANSPYRGGRIIMSGFLPLTANISLGRALSYSDFNRGNYGSMVQLQLPVGVDAAAFLKCGDWNSTGSSSTFLPSHSAITNVPIIGPVVQAIYSGINQLLGGLHLGVFSFPLQMYPQYAAVDAEDPREIYIPIGGTSIGDSINAANVRWMPSDDTLNGIGNIINSIEGFLKKYSGVPLVGKVLDFVQNALNILNNALKVGGKTLAAAWQGFWDAALAVVLPSSFILGFNLAGIVSGHGWFDLSRYTGNWSTAEINANKTYFKDKTLKAEYLKAADDSPNKVLTRGTLPPNTGNHWNQYYNAYMQSDMLAPNATSWLDNSNGWYYAQVRKGATGHKVPVKKNNDLYTWSSYFSPIDQNHDPRDNGIYDPTKSFNLKDQVFDGSNPDDTEEFPEITQVGTPNSDNALKWTFAPIPSTTPAYMKALTGPNFSDRRVDMDYDAKQTPFIAIDGWHSSGTIGQGTVLPDSQNQSRFFRVIDYFQKADITNDTGTMLLPLTAQNPDNDGFVQPKEFDAFMNTHFNRDVKVFYNGQARSDDDFSKGTNNAATVQNGNVINGSYITVKQKVATPTIKWTNTPAVGGTKATTNFRGLIYSPHAWQARLQYRITASGDVPGSWQAFPATNSLNSQFAYGQTSDKWHNMKQETVSNYDATGYINEKGSSTAQPATKSQQTFLWSDQLDNPIPDGTMAQSDAPLGSDLNTNRTKHSIEWRLPLNWANAGQYQVEVRAIDNFGDASNVLSNTISIGSNSKVTLRDKAIVGGHGSTQYADLQLNNGQPLDRSTSPVFVGDHGDNTDPQLDPDKYELANDQRFATQYKQLKQDFHLEYIKIHANSSDVLNNPNFKAIFKDGTTISDSALQDKQINVDQFSKSGDLTLNLPKSDYVLTYYYTPVTLSLSTPKQIDFGLRALPGTGRYVYAPRDKPTQDPLAVKSQPYDDNTWSLGAKIDQSFKPASNTTPIQNSNVLSLTYSNLNKVGNSAVQLYTFLDSSVQDFFTPQTAAAADYTKSTSGTGDNTVYTYDLSSKWYTSPTRRGSDEDQARNQPGPLLFTYDPTSTLKSTKYEGSMDWILTNAIQ